MPKTHPALNAFNRGLASPKGLARVDIEKLRLSAEQQQNWVPRVLGSMSLRPGFEYIQATTGNNPVLPVPFIFANNDTAILEFSDELFRPLVDDAPITRASVSTAVTTGDFSSATGWTLTEYHDGDVSVTSGELVFTNLAIGSYGTAAQTLTVSGGDQNVEHAFRIHVSRGTVLFKAGSTLGGSEYIAQQKLGTGYHSLAFTPTGSSVYIQFESHEYRAIKVNSIEIESSGAVTLEAPWAEADLGFIRYAQSGDVVFMDCKGYRPWKIERRSTRSWSIVHYDPKDGPFLALPSESDLLFSIGAERGLTTLTASRDYFTSAYVGTLYRIFTSGYNLPVYLAKEDAFTPAIRVNGVGTARAVSIDVAGTFSGTLTVQISYIAEDSGFADTATTYTTTGTNTYTESTDNTVVWVRVGFKAGAFTSGNAAVTLNFGAGGAAIGGSGFSGTSGSSATSPGGKYGICRVLEINSATQASVEILSPFSSSVKSDIWQEGQWSDRLGWPSACAFYEGRLFHPGADQIVGSLPDGFESFDPAQVGDSGPIQRSIGYGPVQNINWVLPLSRLVVGGDGSEIAVRSSSFDEPLTPTNFSLKDISTNGSATLDALKIDQRGVFVDRSLSRVMEIFYSVDAQDYTTNDLTQIIPDENISNPVVKLAVQRKPDTRVHCIRQDGTALCLLYEPRENTLAWYTVVTDGEIENIAVLPGSYEDAVYYVIKRTINGSTVRYYEKWAREDECVGGALNKQADSFVAYTGSSTATITGLSHLEGETVVAWGDGVDMGTYTVSGGQVTLSSAVTNAVVGLGYEARYKSAKLAYGAQLGSALGQRKNVSKLGLILYKTHYQGVQHGPDFTNMVNLPLVQEGAVVADDTIFDDLDVDMMEHGGNWNTDSRICLLASAPRPVTVTGMTMNIHTNED